LVAAEEPLEIRIEETPLAVVMRTPGDDDELATGFLLTEGVLLAPSEIEGIDHHTDSRVSVRLCDGVSVDPTQFQRNMFVSSSCGVCGKASIESVQLFARPAKKTSLTSSRLMTLTERLRTQQPTFDATGGLHAAGLLDLARYSGRCRRPSLSCRVVRASRSSKRPQWQESGPSLVCLHHHP
jgi:FdhD protein